VEDRNRRKRPVKRGRPFALRAEVAALILAALVVVVVLVLALAAGGVRIEVRDNEVGPIAVE
jgi:hypothetical protein